MFKICLPFLLTIESSVACSGHDDPGLDTKLITAVQTLLIDPLKELEFTNYSRDLFKPGHKRSIKHPTPHFSDNVNKTQIGKKNQFLGGSKS